MWQVYLLTAQDIARERMREAEAVRRARLAGSSHSAGVQAPHSHRFFIGIPSGVSKRKDDSTAPAIGGSRGDVPCLRGQHLQSPHARR